MIRPPLVRIEKHDLPFGHSTCFGPAPSAAPPAAANPVQLRDRGRAPRGTPDIPGLNIVLADAMGRNSRQRARMAKHHHSSIRGASRLCLSGARWRSRRSRIAAGATIWVEGRRHRVLGSGRVSRSPHHIRNGNRDDNKFIDNGPTYHQVNERQFDRRGIYRQLSQCETTGDRSAKSPRGASCSEVLQTRYRALPATTSMPTTGSITRNLRYCEGCQLAKLARTQTVESASRLPGSSVVLVLATLSSHRCRRWF